MTHIKKKYILYNNTNIFNNSEERISLESHGNSVIIPHVCNNVDVFSGMFASDLAKKFPTSQSNYHLLGKSFLKKNLGHCQIIKVKTHQKTKHDIFVANMIAQDGTKSNNNPRPINYLALARCMYGIGNFVKNNPETNNKNDKIEIHCPKFGIGSCGGNWNFISDLIEDAWSSFEVFVYNPKTKLVS